MWAMWTKWAKNEQRVSEVSNVSQELAKSEPRVSQAWAMGDPSQSSQPSQPIEPSRALQWNGNPYGNGYGVEMNGNGAQFVKMLWIGLDLGKVISLKR